jgi:hypothetical protein
VLAPASAGASTGTSASTNTTSASLVRRHHLLSAPALRAQSLHQVYNLFAGWHITPRRHWPTSPAVVALLAARQIYSDAPNAQRAGTSTMRL